MTVPKSIFLAVFVLVVASRLTDSQDANGGAGGSAGGGASIGIGIGGGGINGGASLGGGGGANGGAGGGASGGGGGGASGGGDGEASGGGGGEESGGGGGGSGGGGVNVSVHGSFSIIGLFKKVFSLPIKIGRVVFKIPILIITKGLHATIQVVGKLGGVSAELVGQIIAVIKLIIARLVDSLVNIGVLQGKTIEEIVNSVIGIIMKLVDFAVGYEGKISATIVDTLQLIIKTINIRGIINKITSLPFINELASLVKFVKTYIKTNFQTQIDSIKALIKAQIEAHKDFFQPIFDRISTKILVIHNALHALVNSDLSACAGSANPDISPTGSLQSQLNIWIDRLKMVAFKILGFASQAEAIKVKLSVEQ